MSATQNKALLSRITIKTVYGDITKPTKETHLMRVYGQCTGFKTASSQYGDSLGFMGQFKAINAVTGEAFTASKCYLPKIVETALGAALQAPDSEAVEFAFDISIKPAQNAFGYEYVVRPVIQPKESAVMAALEAEMGMLQLDDKSTGGKKGK